MKRGLAEASTPINAPWQLSNAQPAARFVAQSASQALPYSGTILAQDWGKRGRKQGRRIVKIVVVKIVVVNPAMMAYVLQKVHRFWCKGKPVLPCEMHKVIQQTYYQYRRNE